MTLRTSSFRGFTIVELLIVIVVIGILSAISVVAFNGIQKRAELARLTSGIQSYSKSMEAYYVVNGAYPSFGKGCLGVASDYTAKDGFTAGACTMTSGSTGSSYDSNLNQALADHLQNPPSITLSPIRVDYGGGFVYDYRGVWVETQGTYYQMQYWLSGNQTCPYGEKTYNASANATRCLKYWNAFN